jgi:hypothetical protein
MCTCPPPTSQRIDDKKLKRKMKFQEGEYRKAASAAAASELLLPEEAG